MEITRRTALFALTVLPFPSPLFGAEVSRTYKLISSAQSQIGITTRYDPTYVRLAYPGGDIPRDRGVCIDVVIRAYRDAFSFDFQKHIHEDMRANFQSYPKTWGLTRTDRNIDHRRVPNLETWLARHGHERPAKAWMPGDIISCRVGGSLPHIGIISATKGYGGRFKAIHNIGLGTREDDRIWSYGTQRRFRFMPAGI